MQTRPIALTLFALAVVSAFGGAWLCAALLAYTACRLWPNPEPIECDLAPPTNPQPIECDLAPPTNPEPIECHLAPPTNPGPRKEPKP